MPFFLRTGKRLPKRASEISVQLKEVPPILFNRDRSAPLDPNVLTVRIQPDEGFALGISSKIPGPRVRIYPVKMDFRYSSTFGASSPEAYERLLLDVMAGDATLFMRRDAVEAAWRWITPILERWEERTERAAPNLPGRRMGTTRSRSPDRVHGTAMANAVADRVWRPSAPDRIDADLTALWREIARDGPVSRAVMSNLVVYCRCPADRDIDLASPPAGIPVEGVASHHPARVILLHHDPDAPDAQRPLAAHVGVLIFGPPGARYGVEQIVIRSACSEAALPSIVRRLMLGDVPTTVWWTEDFSGTRPLTSLVTMGRQLVYDSRRWRDVVWPYAR